MLVHAEENAPPPPPPYEFAKATRCSASDPSSIPWRSKSTPEFSPFAIISRSSTLVTVRSPVPAVRKEVVAGR